MNNLRGAIIFLFLVQFTLPIIGQDRINEYGSFFVKNYPPGEYNATEQNWCAIKDGRGVMYFGNQNNGILEYDGESWRNIPIPNNSRVLSLAMDTAGIIYAGAVGEMGYLVPDKNGKLCYKSFMPQIDSSIVVDMIWKTYTRNDEVYFCTQDVIVKIKNLKVHHVWKLPKASFFSFLYDNSIYSTNFKYGIFKIDINQTQPPALLDSNSYYQKKDVFIMLPHNDNKYITFDRNSGLNIFNAYNNQVQPFGTKQTNNYCLDHFAYNGITYKDDYLLTTVLGGGALIVDHNGKLNNIITSKYGLLKEADNTITNAFCDNGGKTNAPIWLALNFGISKIETVFTRFNSKNGLPGIVMDVTMHKGTIYAGTTSGLYYLRFDENNEPEFVKVPGFSNQVRALCNFKYKDQDKLIAATMFGPYEIVNNKAHILADDSLKGKSIYFVTQSTKHPEKIYLGLNEDIYTFSWTNKNWNLNKVYEEVKFNVESIVEGDEYLWAGTQNSGVYRISAQDKITNFDTTSGLPSHNVKIQKVDSKLFFSTPGGIYKFDKEAKKFVPNDYFGQQYCNGSKGVDVVFKDQFNNFWLVVKINNKFRLEKLIKTGEDGFKYDTIPFKRLPNISLQTVYTDSDNITWICGSDGLYCYNNDNSKNYDLPFNTLIRKVIINNEDLIFKGTYYGNGPDSLKVTTIQPESLIPELSYSNNNITFYYAAPFFEKEDATLYSHYLEGNDAGWSKWHKKNNTVYTNLAEGEYVFRVKARNVYGKESVVATYEFEINPPWQRTIWAYISYVVLSVLFIYFIVKLNARRLIKEKERLEAIVAERTREIREKKDEIEAQRDTLKDLNEEIEKKNENITSSIRYAQRIQNAIMPSDDFIKSLLPNSFVLFKPKDIVSGDFYFCEKHGDTIVFTAVDCTGHGVPGAFVSIVGSNWLTRALNEEHLTRPADIINYLSKGVYQTLQKEDDSKVKDGMDLSMVAINYKEMKGQWAGAYNPLYLYRDGDVIQYKADVFPVGSPFNERFNGYTNHEFDLKPGDSLYVFSDGYIDQFGGPKRKKFMKKRFRTMLLEMQEKPMQEQKEILDVTIEDWKKEGESDQIDDILVFGVRI